MSLVTFAEGTFEDFSLIVPDAELPKSTPIIFELDLKLPVAKAFDLAGAELIFGPMMPEGSVLKDVHSKGNWTVIIEAEADPIFLAAIPAFILANWKFLSLVTIGLGLTLVLVVSAIRGKTLADAIGVPSFISLGWVIAIILGLLIAKDFVKR